MNCSGDLATAPTSTAPAPATVPGVASPGTPSAAILQRSTAPSSGEPSLHFDVDVILRKVDGLRRPDPCVRNLRQSDNEALPGTERPPSGVKSSKPPTIPPSKIATDPTSRAEAEAACLRSCCSESSKAAAMSGLSLIRQAGEAGIVLTDLLSSIASSSQPLAPPNAAAAHPLRASAEVDMANEAVRILLNFGLARRLPGHDSVHIVASEHSQRLFHTAVENQITEGSTVLSEDAHGGLHEQPDPGEEEVPVTVPWVDHTGRINAPFLTSMVRRILALVDAHPGVSEQVRGTCLIENQFSFHMLGDIFLSVPR